MPRNRDPTTFAAIGTVDGVYSRDSIATQMPVRITLGAARPTDPDHRDPSDCIGQLRVTADPVAAPPHQICGDLSLAQAKRLRDDLEELILAVQE